MGNPYCHPISTPVPELQGIATIASKPGEGLAWRLERIRDDNPQLTTSDKGFLTQAAKALTSKVASDTGAGLREALTTIAAFERKPLRGSEGERSATLGWNRAGEWAARIAAAALATDATDGATGGGEVSTPEVLRDPNAVHVNMLRGEIAKPSVDQIIHIYGRETLFAALATTPGVDLLEQAARVGKAIEDAWNGSGSDGRRNDLPPIDLTEHERKHIGAAAIRALSARNQTDDGGVK